MPLEGTSSPVEGALDGLCEIERGLRASRDQDARLMREAVLMAITFGTNALYDNALYEAKTGYERTEADKRPLARHPRPKLRPKPKAN
jgi:hypothetical protein